MKGMHLSNAQQLIRAECREVEHIFPAKNAAYGNSALQPLRVFSKADAVEQIRVRLDHKLSRIVRARRPARM